MTDKEILERYKMALQIIAEMSDMMLARQFATLALKHE